MFEFVKYFSPMWTLCGAPIRKSVCQKRALVHLYLCKNSRKLEGGYAFLHHEGWPLRKKRIKATDKSRHTKEKEGP